MVSKEIQELIDAKRLQEFYHFGCGTHTRAIDYPVNAPALGQRVASDAGYGILKELPESEEGGCNLFVVSSKYGFGETCAQRVSILLYEDQKELMELMIKEERENRKKQGRETKLSQDNIEWIGKLSFATLELMLRASRRGIYEKGLMLVGSESELEELACPELADPKNKELVYANLPKLFGMKIDDLLEGRKSGNMWGRIYLFDNLVNGLEVPEEKLLKAINSIDRKCAYHSGYVGGCYMCPAPGRGDCH